MLSPCICDPFLHVSWLDSFIGWIGGLVGGRFFERTIVSSPALYPNRGLRPLHGKCGSSPSDIPDTIHPGYRLMQLPKGAPAQEALTQILHSGSLFDQLLHLILDGQFNIRIEVTAGQLLLHAAIHSQSSLVPDLELTLARRLCTRGASSAVSIYRQHRTTHQIYHSHPL